MSKPYRASISSEGFLVEKDPIKDVAVGHVNLGRFNTFQEAAQFARHSCIKMGILGSLQEDLDFGILNKLKND